MQSQLLQIFISPHLAKAVCWTLAHSVWEGLLSAGLAGCIILFTRKREAAIRYNLLTANLLFFLLLAGLTFGYEFSQTAGQSTTIPTIHTSASYSYSVVQTSPPVQPKPAVAPLIKTPNLIQQTDEYLNRHANLVTLVWLVCMLMQLFRLSGGLYQIHLLRQSGLASETDWDRKLSEMAEQLGIKRTVRLLQS